MICNKNIPESTDSVSGRNIPQIGVWRIYENQVYLPAFQKFNTVDRSCVCNFYLHPGVFFVKFLKIWHQEIAADGIACTNAQMSPVLLAVIKPDFALMNEIHGRFHMAKEQLAFRCQAYLFRVSDKECAAQLFFQRFDGLTDC